MHKNFLQVLTIRSFLFLWLAEICSQIAINITNFVLILLVFELTHSNTAVSGIVLSYTIPAIIFGILAGVLVDYWNKKRVLLYTNVTRLFLVLLLVVFHTNIFIIFFLSVSISVATQFFIPAETPMIPLIVKKDQLLAANAFFGIGVYGSTLLAYALTGPLLLFLGKTVVFLLLAAAFGVASFLVNMVVLPFGTTDRVEKRERSLIGASFSALLITVRHKDIFHSLFLLIFSQVMILVLVVLGPSYAHNILRIRVEQFPLLFITPAAFGMVVGALMLIHFWGKKSKVILATIGVFLSSIMIFLLPFVDSIVKNIRLPFTQQVGILHIAVVLAFFLGFANAFVFVPSNTIVQEETTDDIRGKVYGVLNAIIGVFSLLPVILVGALADFLGVVQVLEGIGLIILIFGFYRVFF